MLAVFQITRDPQVAAAPMTSQLVTTVISGQVVTTTVQQPAATVTQIQTTTAPTPTQSGRTAPDPNGISGSSAVGALPTGAAFTVKGRGTWHVVPGTTPPLGNGAQVFTYTVEVEDGIAPPSVGAEFAGKVDATLADTRSWIAAGAVTLRRIDHGTPSFRISLTSQLTVRRPDLCGWDIPLEASCYSRQAGRVVINIARWVRGAATFNGDIGAYREYAINHEVGHALDHHHQPCAQNGGLAPVMMQQSWSTSNDQLAPLDPQVIPADHKVCRYNPYPYPRGAAGGSPTGGAPTSAGPGG